MGLNLSKPFIVKKKKLKEVVIYLNELIIENLKKSVFYEEDKTYFYFDNLNLNINAYIIEKQIDNIKMSSFVPKLLILKGKKINNFNLNKDEWLVSIFDIRINFSSENKIYAFILS